MDNYIPTDETLEEAENPFPSPYQECTVMNVNKNAKFKNLHAYVNKQFQKEENRFVIFKSVDGAIEKAVSCVEVFKKQSKEPLYQWTKTAVNHKIVLWKCLIEGPRDIRATVDIPVIFILISKDPFPGELSCMSMQFSGDREIAFLPVSNSRKRNPKPANSGGNRKSGAGNKWTRPTANQRKEENEQRENVFKIVEKQDQK